MGVDDWAEFEDIIERTGVLPSYGVRILYGMDQDADVTLVISHVGTIDTVSLIGVLELAKIRLMEA